MTSRRSVPRTRMEKRVLSAATFYVVPIAVALVAAGVFSGYPIIPGGSRNSIGVLFVALLLGCALLGAFFIYSRRKVRAIRRGRIRKPGTKVLAALVQRLRLAEDSAMSHLSPVCVLQFISSEEGWALEAISEDGIVWPLGELGRVEMSRARRTSFPLVYLESTLGSITFVPLGLWAVVPSQRQARLLNEAVKLGG